MSANTSVKVDSDAQSDIKAFDLGIGSTLGYQLNSGFFVRFHYQYGFTNLFPQGNADNKPVNYNTGLSIGYLFGGNGGGGNGHKNNSMRR